ncbi:MAG: hypothetical protein PCFJNLEI_03169 [Verrucomicrobiae bacterium]|nr:hypothetical protein [Verrucomicrobiae bacterium]
MKSWLAVSAGLMVGLMATTTGRAATSAVFRVNVTLQGVVQSGVVSNPISSRVQVSSSDFINFAFGRPLGSLINPNEALALASDCAAPNLRLIVYDLNSGENLVTVANIQSLLEVENLKNGDRSRTLIADLIILPTGDATNGLTGGELKLTATTTAKGSDCVTSLKGKMIGTLGAVFPYVITNFPCTNFVSCSTTNVDFCVTNCVPDGTVEIINTVTNYNVAVSQGNLTATKRIGTLIEADPD